MAGAGLLILRGVVGLAGRLRIEQVARNLKAQLKQELAHMAESEFPVLSGNPQDCNLAERYRGALVELARRQSAEGRPQGDVKFETQTASRPCLEWLRESERCGVCDWFPEGELASAEDEQLLRKGVSLVSSRTLAVWKGFLAAAGSADEAAALVLELLRFSECVATARLAMRLSGMQVAGEAIGALTMLVAEGRLASEGSLRRVAAQLDVLEDSLPSVAEGIRVEALALAVSLAELHKEKGERGSLEGWLPSYTVAAYRLQRDEALIREMIDAVDIRNLGALRRASESIRTRASHSGSEWLSEGLPNLYTSRVVQEHLVARYRILRTAVDLELVRLRMGEYPDGVSSDALRDDPFSLGQRLRYQRKGSGYRLWSVGVAGLDGEVEGRDGSLVIEVPVSKQRVVEDPTPAS